jgi:hypothetical protein
MNLVDGAWAQIKQEFERVESEANSRSKLITRNLNQLLRRFRSYEKEQDWAAILLDGSLGTVSQAAVFHVATDHVHLLAERDFELKPGLKISLASAQTFSNCVSTREPAVVLRRSSEVGEELSSANPGSRAYVIPILNGDRAVAVLFAAIDENSDLSGLELVAGMAGLVLERTKNVKANVQIAVSLNEMTSPSTSKPSTVTQPWPRWASLANAERDLHARAQRFSRVKVAEMLLARTEAAQAGLEQKNVYLFLKKEIDAARDQYREQFLGRADMRDYLHEQLVATAAGQDEGKLGEDYPGSLV